MLITKYNYFRKRRRKRTRELRAAMEGGSEEITIVHDLVIQASADLADGESPKIPTYSGDAYNGDDIWQPGYQFPLVVNCATATVAKDPQVMLKDHDPSKPIGHHKPVITATSMRLEGGRFSVPNSHRDEVANSAKDGFPWQASIRGRMGQKTLLKAGEKRQINGRTIVGPRIIVDGFLWRETSATGLGANESGPELSIVASEESDKEIDMEFEAFVKACGLDPEKLEQGQRDVLMAAYKAKLDSGEIAAAGQPGGGSGGDGAASSSSASGPGDDNGDDDGDDPNDGNELTAAANRVESLLRTHEIRMKSVAEQYEARIKAAQDAEIRAAQQRADVREVFGDQYPDLQASALKEGWDKKYMQAQCKLRQYETGHPQIQASLGGGMGDATVPSPQDNQVLAASFAIAAGVQPQQLQAAGTAQDIIDKAESSAWRGLGWHGLIRACLRASGRSVPSHIPDTEYARYHQELLAEYAFAQGLNRVAGHLAASTGFTVMNLASIVDDAINKSIHARYTAFQSIIPRVAEQKGARNFRPVYKYRVTGGGFLEKLSATGELNHLRVSDAKFATEVDTQGAMLSVHRKYIIDDDLGVISQFGEILGWKGAQTLERDFHLMILDPSYWRTAIDATTKAPKNYLVGAGTVFGYASMKASHDLFANLQDREGNPINVGPVVLLVQAGNMEMDAKDLNKSERKRTRSDQTTDQGDVNIFYGMLNNVVPTQWLNHQSMGSLKTSTGWFEFSDPNVQPMFGVVYLNDRRVPIVETAPAAFNQLGQQMRVIFDYGMGQVDDVGGVFNKGAA